MFLLHHIIFNCINSSFMLCKQVYKHVMYIFYCFCLSEILKHRKISIGWSKFQIYLHYFYFFCCFSLSGEEMRKFLQYILGFFLVKPMIFNRKLTIFVFGTIQNGVSNQCTHFGVLICQM